MHVSQYYILFIYISYMVICFCSIQLHNYYKFIMIVEGGGGGGECSGGFKFVGVLGSEEEKKTRI